MPTLPRTKLLDVSWTSRQTGWLLESVRCDTGRCARVERTVDGGESWQPVPLPKVRLGYFAVHIAFTPGGIGYLYGRQLWVTRDFGQHWTRGRGHHTSALTLDGDVAYRIAYHHTGCPGPCNPVIQRAVAGTTNWTTVDAHPGGPGAGDVIASAGDEVVAAFVGNLAGGADEHASYAVSTDGGAHWHDRVDPCGGRGHHEYDTIAIAASTPERLTALCQAHTHNVSFIASSTDGTATFTKGSRDPLSYPSRVAIENGGGQVLLDGFVGSNRTHERYWIAASPDFGTHWHIALRDDQRTQRHLIGAIALSVAPDGSAAWIDGPLRLWISNGFGQPWHRRTVPH